MDQSIGAQFEMEMTKEASLMDQQVSDALLVLDGRSTAPSKNTAGHCHGL